VIDHRLSVLRFVASHGLVTVRDVATGLDMHALHVSRHLGTFADDGLLDRYGGEKFRFDVTERGRRHLAGDVEPVPVHPALQPQPMTQEQVYDLVERARRNEAA
jgi:DNA-binding transcriptional ArsR family regulator